MLKWRKVKDGQLLIVNIYLIVQQIASLWIEGKKLVDLLNGLIKKEINFLIKWYNKIADG
jgi:hypothetical protein